MPNFEDIDMFSEYFSEKLELVLTAQGISPICGVDEAGRGPLAGPVVAGAVIFRDCDALWSSCDSKSLDAEKRAELYSKITHDLEYGIGICSPDEIDELNILQASLTAMSRAIDLLVTKPSLVLVDGNRKLNGNIPSRAIVKGDARVAVIGAASIIAKVTRDQIMLEYDKTFADYGFSHHYGYPTPEHLAALKLKGPTPIHRKTFRGVREFFQKTF